MEATAGPGGDGDDDAAGTARSKNFLAGLPTPVDLASGKAMTARQFGDVIGWGSTNKANPDGSALARARIDAPDLNAANLQARGVTAEMAQAWANGYTLEAGANPSNPSAAGRAELMDWVYQVLVGNAFPRTSP